MKYWRGYLVAAVIAFFSWALIQFAAAHGVLVDMFYPYVTRMLQSFLADWSSGVDFSLWQVFLTLGIIGVIASGVLMLVLRWNPFQWFGWVLAAASIVFFLHTGIYGLNTYAGSIADDIRLHVTEYTLSELETSAAYLRDQANALADQVSRDAQGNAIADFAALADQAGEGFTNLVYEQSYSIFAGSTQPVKALSKAKRYTRKGTDGITAALTGEACVNPNTPAASMPFSMCREMAKRMCIAGQDDAGMAAFLACRANSSPAFQYAGYLMAYSACYDALASLNTPEAAAAAQNVAAGEGDALRRDVAAWKKFDKADDDTALTSLALTTVQEEQQSHVTLCDLLVSWYIQEYVLPLQTEQQSKFDPYDESRVDLSGIVNAPVK